MTVKIFDVDGKFALYGIKEDGSRSKRVKNATYTDRESAEKHVRAIERNLQKAYELPDRAMVAMFLPNGVAQSLHEVVAPVIEDAGVVPIDPYEYHVTLVNIDIDREVMTMAEGEEPRGPLDTEGRREALKAMVESMTREYVYLATQARAQGFCRFNGSDGLDALCILLDSPDLAVFREKLLKNMRDVLGIGYYQEHGFIPHITVAYLPDTLKTPDIRIPSTPIIFEAVSVAIDNSRWHYAIGPKFLQKGTTLIKNTEIYENDEGDVVIPVIGVPFGGPVFKNVDGIGRDLDGDFADENTDLGPMSEALCYFDHGEEELWLPQELERRGLDPEMKGFGKDLIGLAKKDRTTPEGVLYNIIVDRRHRYKRLIHRLASEGVIDASSVVRLRENDEEVPGRLKKWHVIAVDLTPAPANPNARSLLKSYLLEEEMGKDQKSSSDANAEVAENAAAEQEQPASQEESTPTPVTDKLKEIFESGDQQVAEAAAQVEQKNTNELIELMKTHVANQEKLLKHVEDLDDKVVDLQTAIPVLGEEISKRLRGAVIEEVGKSESERATEDLVASLKQKAGTQKNTAVGNGAYATKLPPTAPGRK